MRRSPAAVALLALVLLVAGCGDDDQGGPGVAASATQPTAATTATTAATSGGSSLPGERVEIYPYKDAQLAVAGVAAGDKLNVRSGPGTEFDVVYDLAPTAMNAAATGHNRSVGNAFWSEISVDGRTGWANTSFLLQPGQVDDVTASMFPTPAERPTAKTLAELGQAVARRRASEEPPSRIVVVEHPTVGDLGEVTVDVIGMGDDSVGGERLKVFAEPGPKGESFTVRTVEATTFCSRGVADDRRCV
ncbi:MAG TPA: hypothetical protein VFS16_17785 [Acidimicrobiia bacterium]|nr:hypothetical protein [Acidimicrobiia bacterium]